MRLPLSVLLASLVLAVCWGVEGLPEASRSLLEKRERGEAAFAELRRHAEGLAEGKAAFVQAAADLERRLIASDREEKVGKVKAVITDTEAKLAYGDEALQKLAPGKTVVEIRAALQAKLGAERARLKAVEKAFQVRELELKAFEKLGIAP